MNVYLCLIDLEFNLTKPLYRTVMGISKCLEIRNTFHLSKIDRLGLAFIDAGDVTCIYFTYVYDCDCRIEIHYASCDSWLNRARKTTRLSYYI
jgi:hypothetical protein